MKTGIELITEKRIEHITKHGITIMDDIKHNSDGQLSVAAGVLGQKNIPQQYKKTLIPKNWDKDRWERMVNKPYKERLIIAGALYAAEIDRLIFSEPEELEQKVFRLTYSDLEKSKQKTLLLEKERASKNDKK